MKPAAIGLAAILTVVAGAASAQSAPVASSRTVPAQVQNSADAALDERLARDWGLRPEEWARYRQLMQGPLGIYSPNLDPLTALGIEARGQDAGLPAGLRRRLEAALSGPAARGHAGCEGAGHRQPGFGPAGGFRDRKSVV